MTVGNFLLSWHRSKINMAKESCKLLTNLNCGKNQPQKREMMYMCVCCVCLKEKSSFSCTKQNNLYKPSETSTRFVWNEKKTLLGIRKKKWKLLWSEYMGPLRWWVPELQLSWFTFLLWCLTFCFLSTWVSQNALNLYFGGSRFYLVIHLAKILLF